MCVMVHGCNPRIQEIEAGRSEQGHPVNQGQTGPILKGKPEFGYTGHKPVQQWAGTERLRGEQAPLLLIPDPLSQPGERNNLCPLKVLAGYRWNYGGTERWGAVSSSLRAPGAPVLST